MFKCLGFVFIYQNKIQILHNKYRSFVSTTPPHISASATSLKAQKGKHNLLIKPSSDVDTIENIEL